jgi:hypothetical protein
MHSKDVLRYGHAAFLRAIEKIPDEFLEMKGVCGEWSAKQLLAHISSFETLLVEILHNLVYLSPTPLLDRFTNPAHDFNTDQVERRRNLTFFELHEEYLQNYSYSMALIEQIPPQDLKRLGLLGWYGEEYDFEDFVVYAFYGHKREHAAQLDYFRTVVLQTELRDAN